MSLETRTNATELTPVRTKRADDIAGGE